jgi:hypothetical protein
MYKVEKLEFETIHSLEKIKQKMEGVVNSGSIFENNFYKPLSGNINLYEFNIHNNIPIAFKRNIIHYYRVLITGKMTSDEKNSNIKLSIRIFYGEIIIIVFWYILFLIMFISQNENIFNIIKYFGIVLSGIILYTIIKCHGINKELKYYKKLILKTIIE